MAANYVIKSTTFTSDEYASQLIAHTGAVPFPPATEYPATTLATFTAAMVGRPYLVAVDTDRFIGASTEPFTFIGGNVYGVGDIRYYELSVFGDIETTYEFDFETETNLGGYVEDPLLINTNVGIKKQVRVN